MAVNLVKTLLLTELVQGMGVTIRNFFSTKYTLNYPEEKTPQSSFPWVARAATLSERAGALHCLQTV